MLARSECPPRHLLSRKNESVAWRVFVKLGGNRVVCRICGKQMNYQSGSSTSNMVKHLQAVHKDILADSATPPRYVIYNNFKADSEELTTTPPSEQRVLTTEPWMVLQNAPAHLRQRWQDLKLGLHKEMQQHQQAVAWSAIGAPCLGAPAGADLLTDSQLNSQCWGNNPSSNTTAAVSTEPDSAEHSADWQNEEREDSCEVTNSYQYRVKAEPVETDEVCEQLTERSESASPPPQPISPPPSSPPSSHKSSPVSASAPSGGNTGGPPPHQPEAPPPHNKKNVALQVNLIPPRIVHTCTSSPELELRLLGLRRAQQYAEELHLEQLKETRAKAAAAQAERDHRLQLMRHAEEMHQQALEAQKQALEHSRQLHEITLRQAQKPTDQTANEYQRQI